MTRAHRFRLLASSFVLSISFAGVAAAQSPPTTGTPPFGSFGGGPEVINLANLNVHWDVPVLAKAGRGGFNFTYDLSYDGSVWAGGVSSGSSLWYPVGNWGWRGVTEASMGYLSYTSSMHLSCQIWNPDDRRWDKYFYYLYNFSGYGDPFGIPHPLNVTLEDDETGGNCPNNPPPDIPSYATGTFSDGSGYFYSLQAPPSSGFEYVSPPNGGSIKPPLNSGAGAGTGTDRNGNQITVNSSGQFFDTLSSTTPVLTVAGSSPMTFTYTAPSGANASYTTKYTAYTVQTNFACPNISEYGPTSNNLVSEIDLPDWNATTNPNSRYTFTYEVTRNDTHNPHYVTGRLASVTLPTGGTISYTYSGGTNGINCSDGSTATLTRTTPDGQWSYAHSESGTAWTTLITDPQNNQTNINFQGIYETQRQVYAGLQSGGNLLRQWTTCYNGAASPCNATAIALPITRRTVIDQYGSSGLQCKHDSFYNSVGGLTERDDFDYGSGSPSGLLRKTLISYAPLSNNITAFQQTVTVCNGTGSSSSCAGPSGGNTGTVVSQTNYNYDETTPAVTSGITQHTGVSGSRGNLTSVNYPVSGLTPHLTYYDTGVLNTSQDVNGATTTYNYSATNNAYCNWAFPTSLSEPFGWARSMAWNCNGSVLTSVTDENNQTTSITYNDPYFWRPASESFPDGGQTSWTYNSQTSLTTTAKMNSSQNIVSTILLDSLGRTSQTQLSDPQGSGYIDYTVQTYDALGRHYKTYNPTRCSPPTTNCGEATWGYMTTAYDPLNRITSVALQDGSVVGASYSNNSVTAADSAGVTRQSTFDSLGRLTRIIEDPGSSPHLNYVTAYGFDALSDLTNVTQNSGRQRTYVYDAMSRLTSETNPETGTITYKYDSDSNCASPNSSSGDLISRTDARNIRTCFQYDSLHRLTQKNYSDGITPTAFFSWDGTGRWGYNQQNTTGRLGEEWTGTSCCATGGAEIFSYDTMGRVVYNNQYTPAMGNMALNYTFDLAGDMLTATNGVGITFTQSFDTAGRPTGLTSSLNDSQHPGTLATVDTSVGYYPVGAVRKMTFGNNLTQAVSLEPRLQPCRINWNSSGAYITDGCNDGSVNGTIQDYFYAFGAWGSTNNGNVTVMNAAGSQSFSRNFTYDSLNRLATMQETSGGAEGCKPASSTSSPYSLTWGYDAWGNRTSQSPNAGTCSFSVIVNSNNQFNGSPYQYDAAGNMINDGNHTYFYDAESRLIQVDGTLGTCSTATACYFYDALGHRVDKQTGSNHLSYLHDLTGNTIVDYCAPCNGWSGNARDYIFFNGQQIAEYGNSTTYFHHKDHLGSTRLMTGVNQSIFDNFDFLPFGEQIAGGSGTSHRFTGDERDAETNFDHTWFRQYSSQLGRWMHPDPAGLTAVDLANPQSWNRYTYTNNRPTSLVDPSGLCDVIVGGLTQTPGTAATDTQELLASQIGADQAYPYSGLNVPQSIVAAYGSESGDVAADAILNAADQSGGQPFTVYAFSGGAQAVANAWPSLPQSVQNQATVVYISPGHVPFGSSLPPGITYQGQGPLDSFVTALAPNGGLTQCAHNANCEFGALSNTILNGNPYAGRVPQACKVATVFTRGGAGGGGGGRGDNGPGDNGSGGGGAGGSWVPDTDPGGDVHVEEVCVSIGAGPIICHRVLRTY